jgi:hypothetical protein
MTKLSGRHFSVALKGLASAPGVTGKLAYLRHAAARGVYLLIRDEIEASHGARGAGAANRALIDGLTVASDIEVMSKRTLPVRCDEARPPVFNLLIPLLNPGVFFGGYQSYLMFAAALRRSGARVRLIATDQIDGDGRTLASACRAIFPDAAELFQHIEVLNAVGARPPTIHVSPYDAFVAFNCAGAVIATNAASRIAPGRPFIFYIQDEEGHFHAHDSYRAWKQSIYALPHMAIYNSPWLADYFREQSWGPFARDARVTANIAFRHAVETASPPDATELAARKQRKLLFLARPERNTARNLFELGLVALRAACADGLFPRQTWRLHAIGSAAYPPLPMPGGHRLEFLGKLAYRDYVHALPDYDVGLVPMFSPHPSVPNFELARAAVPTVTTAFSNRPKEAMEAACPNLIVCEPEVSALVAALAEASRRAIDAPGRLKGARFDWPRSWRQSFDDEWIARFGAELSRALGAETAQRLMKGGGSTEMAA